MSTKTFSRKKKSGIGKCKLAKHLIELEREAVPLREGARRKSPDKWTIGIVMVKKKSEVLRFCGAAR